MRLVAYALSVRFTTILTSEQAWILYGLVKEHRAAIIEGWSPGIYDGLLVSLMQIDRGGGAGLRNPYGREQGLHYGMEIIEAAIIPPSTYIVSRSIRTVPRPYWDLAATLPELSIMDHGETKVVSPVTVYRATDPLAVIPLTASVLPSPSDRSLLLG